MAANAESALIVGIPVKRMLMLGWALAAGIGAIAGAIIAQYRNVLDFNFMGAVLLFGFAAACVGGFDSIKGAVVGGLLVGHRRDVRPGAVHVRRQRAVAGDGAAGDPDRPLLPATGPVRLETGGTSMNKLPVVIERGSTRPPRRSRLLGWSGSLALLPLRHQRRRELQRHPLGDGVTLAVAILGLNIVTGYSGQISIGHSFFFGIGAYTTMILVADHGWPFLATLPVAGALGFIVGFVIGLPALRIRGLYLSLVTLGLALAFPAIAKSDNFFGIDFASLTGGSNGKVDHRRRGHHDERLPLGPAIVGAGQLVGRTTGSSPRSFVVAIVMFLLTSNLVRSRVGRGLIAMRDNETGAAVSGVYPAQYKVLAFATSALVTSIGGGCFALAATTIGPGHVRPAAFDRVHRRPRHRRRGHDPRPGHRRHARRVAALLVLRGIDWPLLAEARGTGGRDPLRRPARRDHLLHAGRHRLRPAACCARSSC